MKLRYDITLNDGTLLSGGTDLPGALCVLLQTAGVLRNGIGCLYSGAAPDTVLLLAAHPECGVFLNLSDGKTESLSLQNAGDLTENIAFSETLSVSRGLLIPPAEALRAIRCFAESGLPAPELSWTSPDSLPEDGTYITKEDLHGD